MASPAPAPEAAELQIPESEKRARPYATHLRLALAPWTIHFKSPTYIKESAMVMLEHSVMKKTLERTKKMAEVREEIGTATEVWKELGDLVAAAVPSLECRCFAPPDPAHPDYDGLSGPLIAQNCQSLLKDLERLNTVISIARNVLTVGDRAQNLAAKCQFDDEVFKLISVCIKVTARGYDGEAGSADEDKWQNVINAFKKLLITCLQFINNLVARNERRKLMLWVELFDSSTDGVLTNYPGDFTSRSDLWPQFEEEQPGLPLLNATKSILNQTSLPAPSWSATWPELAPFNQQQPQQRQFQFQPSSSPFLLYIGKVGPEVKKELSERGEKAGANELAAECRKRWQNMSESEKNDWTALYSGLAAKYQELVPNSSLTTEQQLEKTEENIVGLARSISQLQIELDRMKKIQSDTKSDPKLVDTESGKDGDHRASETSVLDSFVPFTEIPEQPPAEEADFRMTYNAAYGTDILQRGKDDLMKRLETYPERSPQEHPAAPVVIDGEPAEERVAQVIAEEAPADLSEEEDSEDDDYVVPGDDGRGLLTDVPLILGPTEIEVLPMVIMSGIVPPLEGTPGYGSSPDEITAIKNMHTVRCHLLLAQDNGRNLLRELLIFVAAWDLREEELYFKFMVKIMEAILTNGLMPFSYHAFRESKDIISPAQAVIMKLLTNIFRARQLPQDGSAEPNAAYPMRVDVHMVNFLFTEFRRSIIPQTCALIFLQGQIRAGNAHPEDFPLNLWDMERMYEGVYQYLEFFAILTEHDVWKRMMADWELTSELVTLLKELDAAIPKGQILPPPLQRPLGPQASAAKKPAEPQYTNTPPMEPAPVAVERPYDVTPLPSTQPPSTTLPSDPYMPSPSPYIDETADEPSDFEWRNLKKLTVLVLSSLVWKSRKVQDQVRTYGGIEAILNCCTYDEHNPYIREHAIMCLRFLMEGNLENQNVIHELEPKGVVPSEVLDQHGYETFMDAKGQVGLRRKEGVRAPAAAGPSRPSPTSPPPPPPQQQQQPALNTRDPKDIETLVQQVMREIPTRQQGTFDPDKASALAKLDKTFEKD